MAHLAVARHELTVPDVTPLVLPLFRIATARTPGNMVLAGLEMREWYGMIAPLRTPQPIVDKLNAEMVKIFKKPEVQTQLADMGAEPAGSTSKAPAAQIIADVNTWAKVVKEAGVRPN